MTTRQSPTAAPFAGIRRPIREVEQAGRPQSEKVPSPGRAQYGAAIILFCALALSLTEPRFYADTANYALHIVQHSERHSPPGQDPLWDFGHVLWKPLGYLLWLITG